MKKLTTAAFALVLAGSLTACAKTADTPAPAPSTTSSTPTVAATTPSDTMSSGATSDDTTPSGSATTGTAAPVTVDQTTPEAAMTSWLGAMVAGEGQTVCNLMATGGKTISSIPGAAESCGSTITPMLSQIKQLGAVFNGLKISGATVKGNTATFESVTTTPALAADVVSNFKAVKIDGKWYVSQG
ncbi:hypothetical protein FHX52_3635 [Humibacillus xanthopallidus]|uniref:Uncharacterized protein n=1 Tax=Humibacillus xanthopallidus TaxID=412689 RepID=A0A543PS49_9MICO|nr:hypothetical protein [Humibacillus xanthopallidus]TQN46903.1 hypothetical protein FHX52_3635 [Humibacillus xanthopallidus]